MAIKKGAFDLYVTQRQLPNKESKENTKKNHFFDDTGLSNVNHIQNPHELKSEEILPENKFGYVSNAKELKNGSQKVHERFIDEKITEDSIQHELDLSLLKDNQIYIGSQTTHKRFTTQDVSHNESQHLIDEIETVDANNSSQTVHKQITDLESNDNKLLYYFDETEIITTNYGSQSVHKNLEDSKNTEINAQYKSDKLEINNTNNSSQTVHKQEGVSNVFFNKLVGIQKEIVIALYKNIKLNGTDSTVELTLENISLMSGVNIKSLKNTLFRLRSAGFIRCTDQKIGRGGWVKYSLNDKLFDQIKQLNIFGLDRSAVHMK